MGRHPSEARLTAEEAQGEEDGTHMCPDLSISSAPGSIGMVMSVGKPGDESNGVADKIKSTFNKAVGAAAALASEPMRKRLGEGPGSTPACVARATLAQTWARRQSAPSSQSIPNAQPRARAEPSAVPPPAAPAKKSSAKKNWTYLPPAHGMPGGAMSSPSGGGVAADRYAPSRIPAAQQASPKAKLSGSA